MASTRKKKRRRSRARARRQMVPVLFAVLLIIIVMIAVLISYLYKKYSPSDERMNWREYYGVSAEDEAAIILQDQLTEMKGKVIDGEIYVTTDTLYDYLNSRFYWDSKENLLFVHHTHGDHHSPGGK